MLNNLLIVDDEFYTVEIIKNQFRWEELGIGQVYTAYNVSQAVHVLEQHRIDVAVCDIEMGAHNGLELLEWLRKNQPEVVSFILTGHAQFEYCRKALELGSINYVLKPIEYEELRKVILSAVKRADEQREKSRYKRQSENWERSSKKILTQFWYDVVSDTIVPSRTSILAAAAKNGIPMTENSRYLLLLYHWSPEENAEGEKPELRYALSNMAEELFDGYLTAIPAIVQCTDYCILEQKDPDTGAAADALLHACESLKHFSQEYFGLELAFCLGCFQPPEKMSEQFRKIYGLFQNKGRPGGEILTLERDAEKKYCYHKPDFQIWMALLEAGRGEEFMDSVREYLKECTDRNALDETTLAFCQWDFHHMVSTIADRHLLDPSGVEMDEELWHLSDLDQVEKNIGQVAQNLLEAMHIGRPKSLPDRAKAYIDAHLTEPDISRNAVAEYLDISPEYLSRAFKKQEGLSLMEYIQAQKVELACKLLRETGLPVSEIATRLGYSNFAYFSQIFKRTTGQTPVVYRKGR